MTTSTLIRAVAALLLLSTAACGRKSQVSSPVGAPAAPTQSVSITDGPSLIRAMHARYAASWYSSISYIQTTTLLSQSGANSDQSWYVAATLPGRLRVDYGNPDLGNGLLFRADTSYYFNGGRLARTNTGWNELAILTQDVYKQPPEMTISVLRSLGVQMSRLRTSSFDGRTVYVVGSSSSTDSTSKQFWIERDRLLLVRVREKRGEGRFADIRIGDFVQAGNGWIARQTYQMENGVARVHQQSTQFKVDPPLDPALFDAKQFSTVKHWSKP